MIVTVTDRYLPAGICLRTMITMVAWAYAYKANHRAVMLMRQDFS